MTFARKIAAEALGTTFLLASIVGSGIMGERLSAGNAAIALLANAIATGAMLVAAIFAFSHISGAHFNPIVTLAEASRGVFPWKEVPGYLLAQVIGAFAGVISAHIMFGEPLLAASQHIRSGIAQCFSEFVATVGLLSVIWGSSRYRPEAVPFVVGSYITAGYWFTASTALANPAVTMARSFTNTFSGIRPVDAPWFILAQLAGGLAATIFWSWLLPSLPIATKPVVIAHSEKQTIHAG